MTRRNYQDEEIINFLFISCYKVVLDCDKANYWLLFHSEGLTINGFSIA